MVTLPTPAPAYDQNNEAQTRSQIEEADAQSVKLGSTEYKSLLALKADTHITDLLSGLYALLSDSRFTLPTRTILNTAGSGTWTRPTGCRQIRVRMVAGGAGGGGFNGATSNTAGGDTTFKDVVAKGGHVATSGASGSFGDGGAGGTGGSDGTGVTGLFRVPGGQGQTSWITSAPAAGGDGSLGGSSAFGGAQYGGSPGVGCGGSGAPPFGAGDGGGGGGGGGEYAEFIINNPAASYTYTVGASGNGTVSGSINGNPGVHGCIIIDEFY